VYESKGFERITLQPGEKRVVSFPVGFEQIKFWKNGTWVAEPGTVRAMIGSSSADIRLEGEVESRVL
jgi:beta-glucosidase